MSAPDDPTPRFSPNHHRDSTPRQRQPGIEVWRLLEGDELLLSRRCADEHRARAVAQELEQDTRLAGWTATAPR
jgi:hypothetical protein